MGRIAVAAAWVVTTIGAAVLGWLSTSYLDRGRAEVAIYEVRPLPLANDNDLLDRDSQRFIDPSFLEELQDSVWLTSIDPRHDAIGDIDKTLGANIKDADRLADNMMAFQREYSDLESLTEAPPVPSNAKKFYNKWTEVDGYIYDALTGNIKRGTFDPPPEQTYGSTSYLLSYDTTHGANRLACVHETGGLSSSCIITNNDEVSEDKLREVVMALKYFDQKTLRRYLDNVKEDADRAKEIRDIRHDLETYLEAFSSWTVSALVTNTGSRPISIVPDASVYVNTQNASGFTDNISIPLTVTTKDGTSEPTTIDGGETKLLTLKSKNLVVSSERWQNLLDLFHSGSRNCFVALRVEGVLWAENDAIMSPLHQFGIPANGDIVKSEKVRDKFVAGR